MPDLAIETESLRKHFDRTVAVADLSLAIRRGEVFGFLGPNGTGKTTTVRALGTLIAPTSASATVADIPLTPSVRQRAKTGPEQRSEHDDLC